MSAAERILDGWAPIMASVELVPGTRGVFDVAVDGETLFSKAAKHRFPKDGEVVALLERRFGPRLEWRGHT